MKWRIGLLIGVMLLSGVYVLFVRGSSEGPQQEPKEDEAQIRAHANEMRSKMQEAKDKVAFACELLKDPHWRCQLIGSNTLRGFRDDPRSTPALEAYDEERQRKTRERYKEEGEHMNVVRAELAKTNDRVKYAVGLLKDKHGDCILMGMNVLLEKWDDSRSEPALAEIAKGEPKHLGDGIFTMAGEADRRLQQVRARKEFAVMMQGKNTPQAKVETIRSAFREHPDWLDPKRRPEDKRGIVGHMIDTIVREGDGRDVEIVITSRTMSAREISEYVQKYAKECLAYAREVGCEKAFMSWNFLTALASTRDKDAIALLEQWLKEERTKEQIKALIYALADLPDAQDRLIAHLTDDRDDVVESCVSCLSYGYKNIRSLDAIRSLLIRYETARPQSTLIGYLKNVVRDLEKNVKSEEGKR